MTYEEQYFKQTNEQKLKAKEMDTIKANLDGTPAIQQDAVYLVDWSRLKSIEELIMLLASIGFSFSPQHPQFQNIQHLLDLSRPIQIGNPQQVGQAQEKNLQLPKLKSIK
jgi:hypothetical protein